jgi:hypothetical protein
MHIILNERRAIIQLLAQNLLSSKNPERTPRDLSWENLCITYNREVEIVFSEREKNIFDGLWADTSCSNNLAGIIS